MTSPGEFIDHIFKSEIEDESDRSLAISQIRQQLLDEKLDAEGWRFAGVSDTDEELFRNLLAEAIFFEDLVDAFTIISENDNTVALIGVSEWKMLEAAIRMRLGSSQHTEPKTTVSINKKTQKKRRRETHSVQSEIKKEFKRGANLLTKYGKELTKREYHNASDAYNCLFRLAAEDDAGEIMSFDTFLVTAFFLGWISVYNHRFGSPSEGY